MIKENIEVNVELELLKKFNIINITGFRKDKKVIVTIKHNGRIINSIYNFSDESTYYNYNIFIRKLKKTYCNIFI